MKQPRMSYKVGSVKDVWGYEPSAKEKQEYFKKELEKEKTEKGQKYYKEQLKKLR